MQPWEAYGTSDDEAPDVRICLNTTEEWHMSEYEIHQGITSIKIQVAGDDPSCAFIHVHGTEEAAVRAKWLNAQQVWNDPLVRNSIWGSR